MTNVINHPAAVEPNRQLVATATFLVVRLELIRCTVLSTVVHAHGGYIHRASKPIITSVEPSQLVVFVTILWNAHDAMISVATLYKNLHFQAVFFQQLHSS